MPTKHAIDITDVDALREDRECGVEIAGVDQIFVGLDGSPVPPALFRPSSHPSLVDR
jgi:hypothetical protein